MPHSSPSPMSELQLAEEGVRCRLQGVDAGGEGGGFTLEDEGGRTLAVDASLLSDQVPTRPSLTPLQGSVLTRVDGQSRRQQHVVLISSLHTREWK